MGELEAAQEAVLVAISSLDKAAEKGIIHPNNADRRKSRLMAKLNQAQASAPAEVKPKETKAKPKAAKAKPKAAKKAAKTKPKAAKAEPSSPEKLDSGE